MESVSEDAVFEAIRDRVAARDYLDTVLGVPQEGGNLWVGSPAPPSRRGYRRGTPEYVQARREGLIEPLPALVAATAEMIEEAEAVTGFHLPPLLRRLYLEVGNGGFGPHRGLLELSGGRWTAVGMYCQGLTLTSGPSSSLAPGLLPLCAWGCGIVSFIDCSDPQGPMWGYDPNPAPGEHDLYPEPVALAGWLARWLDGTLRQPCVFQDPVTGQWRGMTDEDWARLEP